MFNFDKKDLQRVAVSSVGAIALSAICIFGVANPANAQTAQAKEWKASVEKQLDAEAPLAGSNAKVGEARIAVRFDDQGRYAGARLVKSSHDDDFDHEAVKAARDLDYPALPAGSTQVIVRMLNGASQQRVIAERTKDAMAVQYASAGNSAAKVNAK